MSVSNHIPVPTVHDHPDFGVSVFDEQRLPYIHAESMHTDRTYVCDRMDAANNIPSFFKALAKAYPLVPTQQADNIGIRTMDINIPHRLPGIDASLVIDRDTMRFNLKNITPILNMNPDLRVFKNLLGTTTPQPVGLVFDIYHSILLLTPMLHRLTMRWNYHPACAEQNAGSIGTLQEILVDQHGTRRTEDATGGTIYLLYRLTALNMQGVPLHHWLPYLALPQLRLLTVTHQKRAMWVARTPADKLPKDIHYGPPSKVQVILMEKSDIQLAQVFRFARVIAAPAIIVNDVDSYTGGDESWEGLSTTPWVYVHILRRGDSMEAWRVMMGSSTQLDPYYQNFKAYWTELVAAGQELAAQDFDLDYHLPRSLGPLVGEATETLTPAVLADIAAGRSRSDG